MHHLTDRRVHTTAFVTPVVAYWLEFKNVKGGKANVFCFLFFCLGGGGGGQSKHDHHVQICTCH